MLCRFCDEEKQLIEAHIIPRCLLQPLNVPPGPMVRVSKDSYPKRLQTGRYDVAFTALRARWLRDAMERALPIIYFYGVAPGLYEALFPIFVVGWDPVSLNCEFAVGDEHRESDTWATPELDERRYAMRAVKQRLHQSMFRERVIAAYGSRCALTNLPEVKLVDAAHIVPDGDQDLGRPDIRNGIRMSKIHHAAFDANLIGVDSKFRIHISKRLLTQHDGPMLEQGLKALDGRQIRLPQDTALWPDKERLEFRFVQFIEAA
jgi:putative restriction endonuclease